MTPYPRPPSPSRRAAIQKERYAGTNPNTLSQKDAAILMDFAPFVLVLLFPPPSARTDDFTTLQWFASHERRSALVVGFLQAQERAQDFRRLACKECRIRRSDRARSRSWQRAPLPSLLFLAHSDVSSFVPQPLFGDATPKLNGASSPSLGLAQTRLLRAASDTSKGELLAWLNANLPSTCPLATDLAFSLRSGRLLVRVLENLTGEGSGISDESFEQFHQQEGLPFDTAYLDTIFSGSFPFVLPPRIFETDLEIGTCSFRLPLAPCVDG